MFMANDQRDLEETGSLIPITKITKIMNISHKTLCKYLKSLETDGYIKNVHCGYIVGKSSKKWLILDKADDLIKNVDLLLKYDNLINQYYLKKGNFSKHSYDVIDNDLSINNNNTLLNNNNTTTTLIPNVYPFNSDEKTAFLYDEKLYKVIGYVTVLMNTNNKYTKIPNRHDYRLEKDGSNLFFKGRVVNSLCSTKSGKKTYLSTDKRWLRSDYLKAYGYSNFYEVFDIKNQIPRLTYILQGGNYDDIDDFYQIDGLDRKTVKEFSMSAYFDKSLKAGAWHKCRLFLNKEKVTDKSAIEKLHKHYIKYFGIVWNHYRTLFNPIGPEIFLWTSLWEQLIIKEAREKLGVNILNVYDSFYYKKDISKELNQIAKETSKEVVRLYKERI